MYEDEKCESTALIGQDRIKSPTVSERLDSEKERLESRLKEVDEAIEMLNVSPEVKNALNAIGKLGHIY